MIRVEQRVQELRRLRRAHRRLGRHPVGLADRAARPQRRRQVDAAADHRRAWRRRTPGVIEIAGVGLDPAVPAAAQRRVRVPALRRVQAHDRRVSNVAFGLKIRKRPKAEIEPAGRRAARAGAPGAVRRPLPGAAVRWAAAAHGAGPRARGRAAGAAARRAVRRAGRAGPQGAAHVAAPPARRGARDDRVRHARPGGGDGGRRQHRGHGGRQGAAGGHARRPVRAARPATSS